MSFLVISDFTNYLASTSITHYSLSKAFYVAESLAELTDTYYLTLGPTLIKGKLTLINKEEITAEFLDSIKFILIGREPVLDQIFNESEILTNLILDKDRKQLIGVKSDSISWLWKNKIFQERFSISGSEFISKHIDLIYCQTQRFLDIEFRRLPKEFKNKVRISLSPMGIPNELPALTYTDTENPYIIDDSYVKSGKELKPDDCLLPLPLCKEENKELLDEFKQRGAEKTVIIFMGRIKTELGKISLMMKDIMKELGNSYELHIFPGRFYLPGVVKNYSPKINSNLELLRNEVFSESTNVFIHKPYNCDKKDLFLQFADIGIDFSVWRPKNEITPVGHCKLLEYCYYGIKAVADRNIINSYLVTEAKNGILLENVPTVSDYVKAIREIREREYDRTYAQKATIRCANWRDITAGIYADFQAIATKNCLWIENEKIYQKWASKTYEYKIKEIQKSQHFDYVNIDDLSRADQRSRFIVFGWNVIPISKYYTYKHEFYKKYIPGLEQETKISSKLTDILTHEHKIQVVQDLHDHDYQGGIDGLIQHLKKHSFYGILTPYRTANLKRITNALPALRVYHIPHHIDSEVFKPYGLEKTVDIFLFGNCDQKYYPFRHRLKKLLREEKDGKLRITVWDGIKNYFKYDESKSGANLAKMINKSWLTICTKSKFDMLLGKYMEVSMSGSVVCGDMPEDGKSIWGENYLALTEDMSDREILTAIRSALSDKQQLTKWSQTMLEKMDAYKLSAFAEHIHEII